MATEVTTVLIEFPVEVEQGDNHWCFTQKIFGLVSWYIITNSDVLSFFRNNYWLKVSVAGFMHVSQLGIWVVHSRRLEASLLYWLCIGFEWNLVWISGSVVNRRHRYNVTYVQPSALHWPAAVWYLSYLFDVRTGMETHFMCICQAINHFFPLFQAKPPNQIDISINWHCCSISNRPRLCIWK